MPNAPLVMMAMLMLAMAAPPPALAEDLPKRKSGLWEIKTSASATKGSGQATQICIDQKSDNATQQAAMGAAKNLCSKNETRRDGERLIVDSVCKFGDSTATTRAVFTGHFDSAYRVETRSVYEPPLMGVTEGSAVIEARWLGPCKPDQKPGDMILPNGIKINVNELNKGK